MAHPLKIWRASNRFSQPEAAKRLGVDAMTVSRWERGENFPHKDQWARIEEVTGISPDRLVKFAHQADAEPAQ